MDEMNTRTVDSLRFSSDERRQLQVAVRGVNERATRMDERPTRMDERTTGWMKGQQGWMKGRQ